MQWSRNSKTKRRTNDHKNLGLFLGIAAQKLRCFHSRQEAKKAADQTTSLRGKSCERKKVAGYFLMKDPEQTCIIRQPVGRRAS